MEKKYKIRKNADFVKAYKRSRRYFNRDLSILVSKGATGNKRFGFTLTRKFGKANKRNRVRRRLTEIVRLNLDKFDDGYDYIIRPKNHCTDFSYDQLEKTLFHCLALSKKKRKKWKLSIRYLYRLLSFIGNISLFY